MVFCEKCGKPMNNDDAFCAYCGAPAAGKALQTVGARKPVSSGKMVDKDGNELIKYSYSESDDYDDYDEDEYGFEDEDDDDIYDGKLDAALTKKYEQINDTISEEMASITSTLVSAIGSAEPEIAYPGIILLELINKFQNKYYYIFNRAIERQSKLQDDKFLEASSFISALEEVNPHLMDTYEEITYGNECDIRKKVEMAERMAYDAGDACAKMLDDIEDDVEMFVTDTECNKIRKNLVRTKFMVDNYASEMRQLLRKHTIQVTWEVEESINDIWHAVHIVRSACDSYIKLRHFEKG